jgi:hypothetical protein
MRDLSFIQKLPPIKQQLLFEGPAMQPPPNVTYNLINPSNKNEVGLGVASTAAIVCTTLVLSRLYSRYFFHKKLAIEDCKWSYTGLIRHFQRRLLTKTVCAIAALVSGSVLKEHSTSYAETGCLRWFSLLHVEDFSSSGHLYSSMEYSIERSAACSLRKLDTPSEIKLLAQQLNKISICN